LQADLCVGYALTQIFIFYLMLNIYLLLFEYIRAYAEFAVTIQIQTDEPTILLLAGGGQKNA